MLKIQNLSVSIGDKKILNKVSCEFEKGKVYAIMGPNGSGKSTLASTVMGHPLFVVSKSSKISIDATNLLNLKADERAKLGIFLSFQTPMSLSGINIYQLFRYALGNKKDALTIRREVQAHAKKLNIQEELLIRSLNDGFSGGEKKKFEVLQAIMLDSIYHFFDEVDTGVDVDAMKTIAVNMKHMKSQDKSFILITHYNRLLKYIHPDEVLIMKAGRIVKKGNKTLAAYIEKNGYDKL